MHFFSSEPLSCLAADEIADISFAAAFEKLQLFLQKLPEGFSIITCKEEICALVMDFLQGLPADRKRFLDFEGLMSTFATKMGREV